MHSKINPAVPPSVRREGGSGDYRARRCSQRRQRLAETNPHPDESLPLRAKTALLAMTTYFVYAVESPCVYTIVQGIFMLQSHYFIGSFEGTRRCRLVDFQGAINRLSTVIERNREALNLPGLAIGVTNRERLLFEGEYGWRNREAKTSVTPDTLFQIGSISKSFSSMVFLQLQEEGVLDINDPVTQYLPWFEVQSEFSPITLRHLLSHTAGIISDSDITPVAQMEAWFLRHTHATAPPGEMFHYSNNGYKVLGLVLETILQQPISQILRERVLQPLGMTASEPAITHNTRSRLATGYDAFYDDRPLPRGGRLAPATWFEYSAADGPICSNAADMCRYLRCLLNRGKGLLSEDSFKLLIHPFISTGEAGEEFDEHYGLGLSSYQIEGHHVIGHSGGMVGYTAHILADMDTGIGVVTLTNGPGDPCMLTLFALKLLLAAEQGGENYPEFSLEPEGIQVIDYVGTYHGDERCLTLTAKDNCLYLDFEGELLPLEAHSPDTFLVPHPSFELFLLRFVHDETHTQHEDEEEAGQTEPGKKRISRVVFGSEVFFRDGVQEEPQKDTPEDWQAYPGHYRSHNPWYPNFRVVLRNGELTFIEPSSEEEPLFPLEKGRFRIGADPRSPEFIRFEAILDGKAWIANLSGGVYSRTFTP